MSGVESRTFLFKIISNLKESVKEDLQENRKLESQKVISDTYYFSLKL
jgi:hypothetical protein